MTEVNAQTIEHQHADGPFGFGTAVAYATVPYVGADASERRARMVGDDAPRLTSIVMGPPAGAHRERWPDCMNLTPAEKDKLLAEMAVRFRRLGLVFIESGGDNLAATLAPAAREHMTARGRGP